MGISEQVKELRELEDFYNMEVDLSYEQRKLVNEAADTIYTLSAKLFEVNMERPEVYYEELEIIKVNADVKKELIMQHDKAFELINKMPLKDNELWQGYVGGVMQTFGFLIDNIKKLDKHYDSEWISFSKQIPKEEQKVLVCRNGNVLKELFDFEFPEKWQKECSPGLIGFLYGEVTDGITVLENDNKIAWQPLPEPVNNR